MHKPKIVIAEFEDWQIIWVNGRQVYQHHGIDLGRFVELANIDAEFLRLDGTAIDEYLCETGSLPHDMSLSRFEKLQEKLEKNKS